MPTDGRGMDAPKPVVDQALLLYRDPVAVPQACGHQVGIGADRLAHLPSHLQVLARRDRCADEGATGTHTSRLQPCAYPPRIQAPVGALRRRHNPDPLISPQSHRHRPSLGLEQQLHPSRSDRASSRHKDNLIEELAQLACGIFEQSHFTRHDSKSSCSVRPLRSCAHGCAHHEEHLPSRWMLLVPSCWRSPDNLARLNDPWTSEEERCKSEANCWNDSPAAPGKESLSRTAISTGRSIGTAEAKFIQYPRIVNRGGCRSAETPTPLGCRSTAQ